MSRSTFMRTIPNVLLVIYFIALLYIVIHYYCLLFGSLQRNDHHPWEDVLSDCKVVDFFNVYNSGLLARECSIHHLDIYDAKVQMESMDRVLSQDPIKFSQPFFMTYPPTFFTLSSPLSYLTLEHAWLAWIVFGIMISAISVWYLLKSICASWKVSLLAATAFLASLPTVLGCVQGQPAFILLPVLVLIFSLMQGRRSVGCGLATSLFTFKPQHTIPIFIAGLVTGRSRYLIGFSVGLFILLSITALQVGLDNLLRFPHGVSQDFNSQMGVDRMIMQNVRGQLLSIAGTNLDTWWTTAFSIGCFVIASLFIGWYAGRIQQESARSFRLWASITILLMLTCSLHTQQQDYMLVVLPCIYFWHLLEDCKPAPATKCLKFLILIFPLWSWLGYWRGFMSRQPARVYQEVLYYFMPALDSLGLWQPLMKPLMSMRPIVSPIIAAFQPDFLWAVAVLVLAFIVFGTEIKRSLRLQTQNT
jgi:hypothetical protein